MPFTSLDQITLFAADLQEDKAVDVLRAKLYLIRSKL